MVIVRFAFHLPFDNLLKVVSSGLHVCLLNLKCFNGVKIVLLCATFQIRD